MNDYSRFAFDSKSETFLSPRGAVATGQEVAFRLRLAKRSEAFSPRLLIYAKENWEVPIAIIPMTSFKDESAQTWYQARFVPQEKAVLFYRFDVIRGENRCPIMKDSIEQVGFIGSQEEHWQLTVYERQPQNFLPGGIVYQIFPDRFCKGAQQVTNPFPDRIMHENWGEEPRWETDGEGKFHCNDYFGGNIEGIVEKLPYLKELGVTAIYLNPIFEAHSNHRYNTADYMKVDPLLGDEKSFQALCKKAKDVGISVILDGVFSHTGSDSRYFNKEGRYEGGAYRDENSPYKAWYKLNDDKTYKGWWGIESLPEVNEREKSFLDFVAGEKGVISHWMELGAAGWRLDVADELPDEAIDAIYKRAVAQNEKAAIIGEVWEDASNKISYGERRRYLLGKQLNSVMNYPLRDAILAYIKQGDSFTLYHTLMTQRENYPPNIRNTLLNSLSTHDTSRALTSLSKESSVNTSRVWQHQNNELSANEYENGKKLLKLASVLQYMLPGVPCLYYGDEAGLFGYGDPFNRGTYPWGHEDGELVEWFKALGQIRLSQRCLAEGEFSLTFISGEQVAFVRRHREGNIYVCINRSSKAVSPILSPDLKLSSAKIILGDTLSKVKSREALIVSYK